MNQLSVFVLAVRERQTKQTTNVTNNSNKRGCNSWLFSVWTNLTIIFSSNCEVNEKPKYIDINNKQYKP